MTMYDIQIYLRKEEDLGAGTITVSQADLKQTRNRIKERNRHGF